MSCWKRELSGVRKEMQTEPGSADSTRFGETLSRTGFPVASADGLNPRRLLQKLRKEEGVPRAPGVELRTDVKRLKDRTLGSGQLPVALRNQPSQCATHRL